MRKRERGEEKEKEERERGGERVCRQARTATR